MSTANGETNKVDEVTVYELKTKLEELRLLLLGNKAILRERLRDALGEDHGDLNNEEEHDTGSAKIYVISKVEFENQLRELRLKLTGNKADLCTRLKTALEIKEEDSSSEEGGGDDDAGNRNEERRESDNVSEAIDEEANIAATSRIQ